jgi:hypothetical protein
LHVIDLEARFLKTDSGLRDIPECLIDKFVREAIVISKNQ